MSRIQIAGAAEYPCAGKENCIRAAILIVEWAVIADKNNDGIIVKVECPEQVQKPANISVHARDHRCISSARLPS